MSHLLTYGFEERLGETLGHGMKVDVAPFLLKAENKVVIVRDYLHIALGLFNMWFHVSFGILPLPWISSTPPLFPFPSLLDTQKL